MLLKKYKFLLREIFIRATLIRQMMHEIYSYKKIVNNSFGVKEKKYLQV